MPDKQPTAARDNEDAPLLADDTASDHGDDARNVDDHDHERDRSKSSTYFRKSGRWILRNRMVVAILCLFLGGFIALCIYFGGKRKINLLGRCQMRLICSSDI